MRMIMLPAAAVCASVLCVSVASAASVPMNGLASGSSISCSAITRDYVQRTLSGTLAKMEFNAATSEAQATAIVTKLDTVVSRATQLAGTSRNANKTNTQCVLAFVVQLCNETKERIVGGDALNDALADFSAQPEIIAALGVTSAMTASIPATEQNLSSVLSSTFGQAGTAATDTATTARSTSDQTQSASANTTTQATATTSASTAVAASASTTTTTVSSTATVASATSSDNESSTPVPDGYTDFRFSLPSSVYEWGAYFYPTNVEARSCKNSVCAWGPVPRSYVAWDIRGVNGNETLASAESSSVTLSGGRKAYTLVVGPRVQTTPTFGASIYGWHPDYSGLMGIGSPSDYFADASRKITVMGKFTPPTGSPVLTFEREMSILNEFDAKLVSTNSFLSDKPSNASPDASTPRHALEIQLLRSGALYGNNPVLSAATTSELSDFEGECTVASTDGRYRGAIQYLNASNQVVTPSSTNSIPTSKFVVSSFPIVPAGTIVWVRCRLADKKSGHVKNVSVYEKKQ